MNSILQLLLLACFSILPYVSFAITSLGSAIIFQITWQIAYLSGFKPADDFVLGIVLFLIALAPMVLLMIYLLWDSVDFRLTALFGLPAAVTSLIGVEVLVSINQTWLRRGLGALLLVTYATLIVKKRLMGSAHLDRVVTAKDLLTWWTFFTSLLIGVCRGLFGLGGPPVMIWAAVNAVPKDICRANLCASLVIQLPITLTYLLVVKELWQNDQVKYYVASIVGASVGVAIGFLIGKRVNERIFQLLLKYIILSAGSVLVCSGLNPIILQAVVALVCISVGIVFGKLILGRKPFPGGAGQTDEMASTQNRQRETMDMPFIPKGGNGSLEVPILSDQ